MTKEYHALRLRNALDPKRHYKGQGSSKVVPEVFAVRSSHPFVSPSRRSKLTLFALACFVLPFAVRRSESSTNPARSSPLRPSPRPRPLAQGRSSARSWATRPPRRTPSASLATSRASANATGAKRWSRRVGIREKAELHQFRYRWFLLFRSLSFSFWCSLCCVSVDRRRRRSWMVREST